MVLIHKRSVGKASLDTDRPEYRVMSEIIDPDDFFVSLHAVLTADEEGEAKRLVKGSKVPSRRMMQRSLEMSNIGKATTKFFIELFHNFPRVSVLNLMQFRNHKRGQDFVDRKNRAVFRTGSTY